MASSSSRRRSRSRTPSKRRARTPMGRAKSVVALVNLKSGGHRCALYVQGKLERQLGASHVHTLFCGPPSEHVSGVEAFLQHHAPDVVIVAGGDGTISFVMDVVKSMHESKTLGQQKGIIAPFPLGTGNDLCVSLGFGSGFARWVVLGGVRFRKMLRRYNHAVEIPVNRWRLAFHALDEEGSDKKWPSKRRRAMQTTALVAEEAPLTRVMNNYLSIGFDAAVAERLNTFRAHHPHLFITRPVVKLWYAVFGAMALFTERTMSEGALSVLIDGVEQPLPQGIKAVVVSNMLTYAGGSPIWRDEPNTDMARQSVSDGLVEVTTLRGVWHLALVRLGLTYATKVGQGQHVQIHVRKPCRMQYDGEPIAGLFDGIDGAKRQYSIDIAYYTDSAVLEARLGAARPTFFSVYWPLILTGVAVLGMVLLYFCSWP